MEAPLIEKLNLGDIVSSWGTILTALAISILGFLIARARKNINISWVSSLTSAFVILVYSVIGKYYKDPFNAIYFDKLFLISAFFISIFTIVSIFIALSELESKDSLSYEFFFFIFLSAIGGLFMTSSQDFLTLFISKELLSFPIYAMVYALRDKIGVEAAVKYFITGSVFSLIYLIGFAFFLMSEETIAIVEPKGILGVIGVYLILISLLFKGGVAPFHFWVPDVYQGAPASVITFAGSVVKFSAFVTIARFPNIPEFSKALEFFAIASIVVGVLGAIVQKEIKRLVAYSSIAHSGFIIFFLFSIGNIDVKNYLIFYLAMYGIATAGTFAIISLFRNTLVYLDDIVEFSRKHRFISSLLAIFFISFAGIPLTAGFFAKYLSFLSALYTQKILPVIFGAVGSIASLYFYFQPLSKSFMENKENKEGEEVISINPFAVFLIAVLAGCIILFGIYPEIFFKLTEGIPLSF